MPDIGASNGGNTSRSFKGFRRCVRQSAQRLLTAVVGRWHPIRIQKQQQLIKGYALAELGCYEDAIAAYDAALKIKPDAPNPYYNKACAYALQGQINPALENLQQAIQLAPDECREMAQTDSDFDAIRADERFQTLLNTVIDAEK